MKNKDLFGEEIIQDVLLRDKFIENPFSVLDTKIGRWQNRKKEWIKRGIESEIGRNSVAINTQSWVLEKGIKGQCKEKSGVSIFDPALCEVLYHWFCPEHGEILDPFAGG